MNPRTTFSLGLFAGALITSALVGLHADWYGREKYAQFILDHWSSGKWTVTLAIFNIVVGVGCMFMVSWRTRPRPTPPTQQAVGDEAGGAWGWGCEGRKENRTVTLRFSSNAGVSGATRTWHAASSSKKATTFEMSAPVARRVARYLIDEATYSEQPEDPNESRPRETSWAKLDSVDLDEPAKTK